MNSTPRSVAGIDVSTTSKYSRLRASTRTTASVEIKTVDGETEELDSTEWVELDLEAAEAPEDYVDPDDDDDDDEDEARRR